MNIRYLIFNKPYSVLLSQFTDEGTGHSTLKQYIQMANVYAAGRLDRDSEGLLLLTDDGALIKKLTDPKHHIEKTYWVMVEGDPTQDKLTQLERGIQLKDYWTLACQARLISALTQVCRRDPSLSLPMVPPRGSKSNYEKGRKDRFVTHLHRTAFGAVQV